MEEAQAPLPAGTVIYAHYIVESLLGKGDFGNVYLVRDQRNEQKLFALAELFNPARHEGYRFALNYVSLAPLDRRVLPSVQYIYHDNKLSRAYLLMNYIEEPNLEALRLRQAEQRFPLPQVLSIMTPIVDALTYLHHMHSPIIHGNINPTNIILSQTIATPVLAMLDLFKEHDSTATPLHYFAPGYGATEQYYGKFSPRSDIYGLGATYYTLLTGRVPPDAIYRSTQLSNRESDPLQPANKVIPAIPRLIAEAIQQAMSLNADDRFSSVEQFHREVASPTEQSSPELLPATPSIPLPPPAPATPVPQEPDTSHPEEQDSLQPATSRQADAEPASTPVPEKPRAARVGKTGVLLAAFALLISLGAGTGFWFHARSLPAARTTTPTPTVMPPSPTQLSTATPVPSPYPTFVPSPYPTFAGTYIGTIFDLSANISGNISLTGVQQNQENISGYLTLGPDFQDSGPFRGTIDATKHFQFIVTDAAGNARLFFEGDMQSATNLTGDYYSCSPTSPLLGNRCDRAPGSYGIWDAVLT